ncbi:MAG: ABC transporter substrate-binding protein, partial [Acidimicrobiia bacterium]
SDTTLRVELSERPGLGTWPHGIGLAPIMPAHVWRPLTIGLGSPEELYALDGATDVSGGPLQIVTAGETRIVSEANPGYPDRDTPEVTYTVFADEAAAVSALRNDEIDTVLNPNGLSQESLAALGEAAGVAVERSPANSIRYLGFNLTRAPMSEPAFRHGLALLLDRDDVTQTLLPEATPAYTVLSEANARWFDEASASSIAEIYGGDLDRRVAEAISGLGGAGYTWETAPALVDGALAPGLGLEIDGHVPAPLTILTPGDEYDPARPDYTTRIESTLELIGFDVRPVVTDFDTVVDLAFSEDEAGARQYDMYLLGWTLGSPARPDYYGLLFGADEPANSTGYSDPEFGAYLSRYEEATRPDEAKAALWGMETALAEDLPYLVLYHPGIAEGYRSDRVRFGEQAVLGGIQGRLGGLADLEPVG